MLGADAFVARIDDSFKTTNFGEDSDQNEWAKTTTSLPGEDQLTKNGQPAMSMLLQGSTDRLHSEMTHVFGTWRISNSRCSIWCATRQRRTRSDRDRVAGGRAVLQLLLCCWPSGARGHLLWLLLLLELLVVVLAALLLLLPVVAVHQ